MVDHLLASMTSLELSDSVLKVLGFQVKLLLSDRSVLLVACDGVFEEGLLSLHDLNQFLSLSSQSVDIFVR